MPVINTVINTGKRHSDSKSVGDISSLSSDYFASLPTSPPPVAQPVKPATKPVTPPTASAANTSQSSVPLTVEVVNGKQNGVSIVSPTSAASTTITEPASTSITTPPAIPPAKPVTAVPLTPGSAPVDATSANSPVTSTPAVTDAAAAASLESVVSQVVQASTITTPTSVTSPIAQQLQPTAEPNSANTAAVESFTVSGVNDDATTLTTQANNIIQSRIQVIKDGWLTFTDSATNIPHRYFFRISLLPSPSDRTSPPTAHLQCFTDNVTSSSTATPTHSWPLNHRVSINSSGTKLTLAITDKTDRKWMFACDTPDELENWVDAFSTVNSLLIKFDALSSDVLETDDNEPLSPRSMKLRGDTKTLLPRRYSVNPAESDLATVRGNTAADKLRAQQQAEQRFVKQVKCRMFQKMFGLPSTEELIEDYSCAVSRAILLHGRMYISANYVCFFSSIFSHKTTVVIPIADILHVQSAVAALVFDNSIKIYLQTDKLPMHTHTAIGRISENDGQADDNSDDDNQSDVSSVKASRVSPSTSPVKQPTPTGSIPTTPTSTSTLPSVFLDDASDSASRISVTPQPQESPKSSKGAQSTTPGKPPGPKTLAARTIHSTNGMLSLPLIDLLEYGHPSITTHFFASFITRDHALNLITSLVNARQRAYYEKHGFEVKPIEPTDVLQPSYEPTKAAAPDATTAPQYSDTTTMTPSASTIDVSQLTGYAPVTEPVQSVALPSLAIPSFETVVALAPTISQSKQLPSSGDISSMSNEDIRVAAQQAADAALAKSQGTETPGTTDASKSATADGASPTKADPSSQPAAPLMLDGKQLPAVIAESSEIDMQAFRPHDTELTDCEWEEVLDVTIPVSAKQLFYLFFSDTAPFSQNAFQSLKGDSELRVSTWRNKSADLQCRDVTFRQVLTNPMAPPSTRVFKTQTLLRSSSDAGWLTYKIESRCLTPDVPIAGDCVMVCDNIVVDNIVDTAGSSAPSCRVRVALGICFLRRPFKIRPLVGTIKSQTKKDIKGVWELWNNYVNKFLAEHAGVVKQAGAQQNWSIAAGATPQPAAASVAVPAAAAPASRSISLQPAALPPPPQRMYDPISEYSNGMLTMSSLAYIFAALALALNTVLPSQFGVTSSSVTQTLFLSSLIILLASMQRDTQQLTQYMQQLVVTQQSTQQQVVSVAAQIAEMSTSKLVVRVQDDYIPK